METKFNFNSQICTDINQSERLLAVGLKKETADCHWFYCDIAKEWKCAMGANETLFKNYPTTVIPAWSLHRLILLLDTIACDWIFRNGDCYTNAINGIEWLIKEGYFNKEYLV